MLFAEAPAALEAILWEEGTQVIEGKKVSVIRRRETMRDMLATEISR